MLIQGTSTYEKMSAVVKQNLRPKKLDDMHPDLCKLLQKAWHADPEQRPTARGTSSLLASTLIVVRGVC
jgi:hypothetical protein